MQKKVRQTQGKMTPKSVVCGRVEKYLKRFLRPIAGSETVL